MSTNKVSSEYLDIVLDVIAESSGIRPVDIAAITGKSMSAVLAAIGQLMELRCISKGADQYTRKDGMITYKDCYWYEQDLPEGYRSIKRVMQTLIVTLAIAATALTAHADDREFYDTKGQRWECKADTCVQPGRGMFPWERKHISELENFAPIRITHGSAGNCYLIKESNTTACWADGESLPVDGSRKTDLQALMEIIAQRKADDERRAAQAQESARESEAQQAAEANTPAGTLKGIGALLVLIAPFIFIYWCGWRTYVNVRDDYLVFFNTGMDTGMHVFLTIGSCLLMFTGYDRMITIPVGLITAAYVIATTIRNNKGVHWIDITCALITKALFFVVFIPYVVWTWLNTGASKAPNESPVAYEIRRAASMMARAAALAVIGGIFAWLTNGDRVRAAKKSYYEDLRREYDDRQDMPADELDPEPPSDFATLGVSDNASWMEVEAAYKKKIMMNHPDKLGNMDEDIKQYATKRAQSINAAYGRLKERFGKK